ncbi:hypothetical protein [Christiangramia crocea]|uniref:Lipoprotein n=1 Tax=Christiangramia crocea TaxID=2904124 RepID=A0A9X2A563_9FLAO|nr:hypothetical protein [Gramella crocea]MCG9970965.1 hypothetical protein [Gramella crocea]
MKIRNCFKVFCLVGIFFVSCGCIAQNVETQAGDKENTVSVYNIDNTKDRAEYARLDLDSTHPNLLNPQISQSDYNEVIKSWTDLHQRIGKYLADNEFKWEVEDSTITIVQKIYFKPDGEIKNYFFKIQNDEVTREKKEQFGSLLLSFARKNRISFQKEEQFAQCGKTRYYNH